MVLCAALSTATESSPSLKPTARRRSKRHAIVAPQQIDTAEALALNRRNGLRVAVGQRGWNWCGCRGSNCVRPATITAIVRPILTAALSPHKLGVWQASQTRDPERIRSDEFFPQHAAYQLYCEPRISVGEIKETRIMQYKLRIALLFILAMSAASEIHAAVIFQSATLGPTGQTSGSSIDRQFLGSRFSLSTNYTITGIGGHLFNSFGSVWAAIIEFPDADSLPSFDPIDIEAHSLVFALFESPTPQASHPSELRIQPVEIELGPGDYGLVLGGNQFFGSTGAGGMPGGGTPASGVSYFVTRGFAVEDSVWGDGPSDAGWTFVVEGQPTEQVVPESSSVTIWAILVAVTAGGMWIRRQGAWRAGLT